MDFDRLLDVTDTPYSLAVLIALAALLVLFFAYVPVKYLRPFLWLATTARFLVHRMFFRTRKAARGMLLRIADKRRRAREKAMSDEVRSRYVKSMLADIITNGLEDALNHGKIRRSEVNSLYELVGAKCGVADLLRHNPRRENPAARKARETKLKQQITARIGEHRVREFMATRKKSRVIAIPRAA